MESSAQDEAREAGGAETAATPESSRNEADLTTAKLPEFDEVDETVYVKTADGTPVNVRSSCNKQNNSNVVTTAAAGTELKRTGVSGEWSRVVLNGEVAYIATDFLSTEVPETTAASGSANLEVRGFFQDQFRGGQTVPLRGGQPQE